MAPFNHSHFQTAMPTDTSNKMEGLSPNAIKGSLTKWKIRFFLGVNWKGQEHRHWGEGQIGRRSWGCAISGIHMRGLLLALFSRARSFNPVLFSPLWEVWLQSWTSVFEFFSERWEAWRPEWDAARAASFPRSRAMVPVSGVHPALRAGPMRTRDSRWSYKAQGSVMRKSQGSRAI